MLSWPIPKIEVFYGAKMEYDVGGRVCSLMRDNKSKNSSECSPG